ncbi:hypothetical protein GCM10009623_28280 [Nocardioides aestuarii]|uniref:Uncharacterized protein n=1 Tax=Nocardioides aestuarii TaxID=252231 RepID=A0ABW4TPS6_9ACTN
MTTEALLHRGTVGSDGPAERSVPWGSMVLPLAALVALADQFIVVVLRTSVGSIERTSDPALSWVRESVELLPVHVVAVVVALALVSRRWGDVPRGRGPAVGTVLVLAATTALAGAAILLASSLWDYHLQAAELVHHAETHRTCVDACLTRAEHASLVVQLKAVGVGIPMLAVTNVVLLGWAVALRGRPIVAASYRSGARPRVVIDDRRLALVLALVGSALVHAAVVPEHMGEWRAAGVFFVVVELAQVTAALWVWRQPGRLVLVLTAVGSVGLVVLWAVSRTAGLPFGPEAWEPEPVGLADLSAGALEVVAVACCLSLLRAERRGLPRGRQHSAHLRGAVVAAIVAVTVLGIGGSGLPAVDLLSGTGGHHDVDAAEGQTGAG